MKKTIIIFVLLFAIMTFSSAQTFKIEDLAKKTWVRTLDINREPISFSRKMKTNFNLDNTCHTDITQYNNVTKKTLRNKDHGKFYLSDTPDTIFNPNKLKNKTGKYIIKQYNASRDIAVLKIISMSDKELKTEVADYIRFKPSKDPDFVGSVPIKNPIFIETAIAKENLK